MITSSGTCHQLGIASFSGPVNWQRHHICHLGPGHAFLDPPRDKISGGDQRSVRLADVMPNGHSAFFMSEQFTIGSRDSPQHRMQDLFDTQVRTSVP